MAKPLPRIVAATRNPAKLREFERVAGGLATVEALPRDISLPVGEQAGIESARDLMVNAVQKALAWSLVIRDRLVMASDGGLSLPALGSRWNPSRTRRFAGAESSDLERARRLLAMAAHLRDEQRTIGWTEALGIAWNGRLVFDGVAGGDSGFLATDVTRDQVEAAAGFWVSAVWICPEFEGRRLAELATVEREQRADHWAALGTMLRPWLASWGDRNGPASARAEPGL